MDKYIDLHVHTNASDGKLSPQNTIIKAVNNGVSHIALTEHYNLGSYKKARQFAKAKYNGLIEVIPGIEIGASLLDLGYSKNHVCHILAYYPSYNICKILDTYELSREKCVRKTLVKLKKYINISYSDVVKYARNKNSIGRFDIAIAMARLGYSKDPIIAYGDFLDTGKSCYVDRQKMSAKELILNIRRCHGLPVLAHPKSLKMSYTDMYEFIKKLKDFGLEGIEVYNSHHTEEQVQIFEEFSSDFNLLKTVGSDFHGKDDIEIGCGINNNLCINNSSLITALKEKHHNLLYNV